MPTLLVISARSPGVKKTKLTKTLVHIYAHAGNFPRECRLAQFKGSFSHFTHHTTLWPTTIFYYHTCRNMLTVWLLCTNIAQPAYNVKLPGSLCTPPLQTFPFVVQGPVLATLLIPFCSLTFTSMNRVGFGGEAVWILIISTVRAEDRHGVGGGRKDTLS